MVKKSKFDGLGLTPEQEELLVKGMATKRDVEDTQYRTLQSELRKLGVNALLVGKFLMISKEDAERIVNALRGPGESIRQKPGTFLKLVTDNEKGDK